MAGKETLQQAKNKGVVDKGLDTWQEWNKFTLKAEGVAIFGGLIFGVPWLVALATTGAVVDGAQIIGINEVKRRRSKKDSSAAHSSLKQDAKVIDMAEYKRLKEARGKSLPPSADIVTFPKARSKQAA